MTESEVQSIGLFFFYALLDEQKAIEASSRAFSQIQSRLKNDSSLKTAVAIVAETKSVWEKYKNRGMQPRSFFSISAGWKIPADLEVWREFQKRSREDELLAVIWSKILKIRDEDIAEGLRSTQGTIRYRLGLALRKIGNIELKNGKLSNEFAEK